MYKAISTSPVHKSGLLVLLPKSADRLVCCLRNVLPPGSDELKKALQYHFIPGKWTPEKLKDRMLLETALEEEGLDGGRQVLSVDVSESFAKDKTGDRSIRFGGAGTIGDPSKSSTFQPKSS